MLFKNEKNPKTIYNHTVDICSYKNRRRGSDQIFKFIYEHATTAGHLPKACPVTDGLYYVKDYTIDENMFPSFIQLPDAVADMVTAFYTNVGKKLVKIFDSKWKAQVTNK